MTLKDDWETGDVFTAADANAVADAINGVTFEADSSESAGDALTRINAALAAGDSLVRFRGDFEVNGPISIPSGVTVDATDATFSLVTGSYTNLLVNAAALANARTIYAAMTSGSATLTAAGIDEEQPAVGPFDSGMVGEPVIVQGAGTSGAPLVSTVASYTSATQITLDDNAGTTVSGQYATVGERDSDITVIGGVWARASANNDPSWSSSSHYLTHTMRFRHCDGLRIIRPTITGSAGKYAIAPGDCTDVLIDGPYMPVHTSDGVHVNGPASNIVIRAVQGGTLSDDLVSLTAGDSQGGVNRVRDVAGDINGVVIQSATYIDSTAYSSALKIIAGLTMDDSAHYHVTNVRAADMVGPTTAGPVMYMGDPTDDGDSDTYTEILYDHIFVDGIRSLGGDNNPVVLLHGGQVGHIHIKDIHLASGDLNHVRVDDVGVQSLTVDGLTGGTSGEYLVVINAGADVEQLAIRRVHPDWDLVDLANGGRVLTVDGTSAVGTAILEDAELYASSGHSFHGLQTASGATLGAAFYRGITTAGTGTCNLMIGYASPHMSVDGVRCEATTTNLAWAQGAAAITLYNPNGVGGSVTPALLGNVLPATQKAVDTKTGTSYTLVSTDANKLIACSNTSTVTVTVPANSSVAFPIGTVVHLVQTGVGQVAISSAYVVANHGEKKIRGQYGVAKLEKVATDLWLMTGDLANASNAQTGTSYTLVLTDQDKLVTLSNGSAITLTVPLNSSVAFPVGTIIDLAQTGAGQVTIAPAGGVTINSTPGLKISAQYGGVRLRKTSTDTWLATGNLSA